jgi:hypothetical protein
MKIIFGNRPKYFSLAHLLEGKNNFSWFGSLKEEVMQDYVRSYPR